MLMNHQEQIDKPHFVAKTVNAKHVATLGDLCVYFTYSGYAYMTIEEATALRDALNLGLAEAHVARQARLQDALTIVREMGKVYE